MPATVTFYDISGTEPVVIERRAVDAREILKSDPKRYVRELPDKPKVVAPVEEPTGLEALTKAKLIELAKANNVEVTADNNKSEIIEKLRAANVAG